jgi:hypothetical protein
MENKELDWNYTYHAPDEEKKKTHELVRLTSRGLAKFLNEVLPEGREKALALTKLEEVVMWANASIAREK